MYALVALLSIVAAWRRSRCAFVRAPAGLAGGPSRPRWRSRSTPTTGGCSSLVGTGVAFVAAAGGARTSAALLRDGAAWPTARSRSLYLPWVPTLALPGAPHRARRGRRRRPWTTSRATLACGRSAARRPAMAFAARRAGQRRRRRCWRTRARAPVAPRARRRPRRDPSRCSSWSSSGRSWPGWPRRSRRRGRRATSRRSSGPLMLLGGVGLSRAGGSGCSRWRCSSRLWLDPRTSAARRQEQRARRGRRRRAAARPRRPRRLRAPRAGAGRCTSTCRRACAGRRAGHGAATRRSWTGATRWTAYGRAAEGQAEDATGRARCSPGQRLVLVQPILRTARLARAVDGARASSARSSGSACWTATRACCAIDAVPPLRGRPAAARRPDRALQRVAGGTVGRRSRRRRLGMR